MRTLHDVQETTLSYKPVEIVDGVATEFLVVKIQPEPKPCTAVVDVEGARLGVLGNDKEHEQGLRELDPSCDLGVLSRIQQSLHRSIRASANLVWCVPKINHWDYVHLSKHGVPPLKCEVEINDMGYAYRRSERDLRPCNQRA